MNKFVGKDITKNTVFGISLGSIIIIIVSIWTMSGIGRPLFASDLSRIEQKIDLYQTNTAIQILNIRRAALQTSLREAKRDLRRNPDDGNAEEDVDDIKADIEIIENEITCHRTIDCLVIGAI